MSKRREMQTQEGGVVAFLDALGIKGIWARVEPETVLKSWNKVLQLFAKSIKTSKSEFDSSILKDCRIAAFSDTVIVTMTGPSPVKLLPLMAEVIWRPFYGALLEGIYFRGVISIGRFYKSSTLLIGPAVDEAAEWYTYPEWIGVSTTPTASFSIERFVDEGLDVSKWFVKYDIPTKAGIDKDGWALAWPKRVPVSPLIEGKRGTIRTAILETFASQPIGISAITKFKNTMSFFDYVIKENSKSGQS